VLVPEGPDGRAVPSESFAQSSPQRNGVGLGTIESQDDLLELLLRAGEVRTYTAGETIFNEGDEPDAVYVLGKGTVAISIGGTEVERLEGRGIFGEMALIESKPRSGTALAATDCELALVEARRFWFLVQETPFFARLVMRVMAQRLRRADEA
jgi:CRP/FNR family cyclic AMP-dependent transcriptional regulator